MLQLNRKRFIVAICIGAIVVSLFFLREPNVISFLNSSPKLEILNSALEVREDTTEAIPAIQMSKETMILHLALHYLPDDSKALAANESGWCGTYLFDLIEKHPITISEASALSKAKELFRKYDGPINSDISHSFQGRCRTLNCGGELIVTDLFKIAELRSTILRSR